MDQQKLRKKLRPEKHDELDKRVNSIAVDFESCRACK